MVSWFPLPLPCTLWFNHRDLLFCFTSTSLKMQFPLPKATTTTTTSHTQRPAKLLGKKQVESESRFVVSDSLRPLGLYFTRLRCPWNSPDKNTAVGSHPLLQGIFPTQGLNPGLLHCSLPSGLPGKPLLMFKAQLEVLVLCASSSSLPPLKCPIYSTSSLSRPFASTQSQCMLLLFLLKIYILPKTMPVARDTSMNSTIKVVIIIELTLARGQDSLPQDIPHWHIILHWSHSWCGATCFFNKTAAAATILRPSSFPWKQEINLPCWSYPPYTNILITRDREFKAKKPV